MSPQFKKDCGTAISVQLFAEWLATINRGNELSFLIGHQLILPLVHDCGQSFTHCLVNLEGQSNAMHSIMKIISTVLGPRQKQWTSNLNTSFNACHMHEIAYIMLFSVDS